MFPYDPALKAAVQSVPTTVSDVLGVMNVIESICVDGDGLKWFNWLYLQVTQAVEMRVMASGFTDVQWLADLDVQFARLYFGALNSWLAGQSTPSCWRILFERRRQTDIARIQFALAGINAHINHDLPEAIVATCDAAGTVPHHGSAQYVDYTAMNVTLDSLVEAAKRTLHVRLLGDALPEVSHLENLIAAFSVSSAREAAWNNGEIFWHVRTFPALSTGFLSNLDGLTSFAGQALLVPVI